MNPDDLRHEQFYTRLPFGGRAADGVRIVHVESGLSTECSEFASLHKNAAKAKVELETKLESAGIGRAL